MPGIESILIGSFKSSWIKTGQMKSFTDSRVSCTSSRIFSLFRNLLRRRLGKVDMSKIPFLVI